MRSLIIRFEDCEGPGILESILKEEGYAITYLDAFRKDLSPLPNTHQIFDFFLIMGGSASVYDPEKAIFLNTYISMVRDILKLGGKKVLGICLGAQILAKAMGAGVKPGATGKEIGYGTVDIIDSNSFIFNGLEETILPVVHFHGDIFEIPAGTSNLLSSQKYENQMFSNGRNVFGILPHFEITESMFHVWKLRFPEFRIAVSEMTNAKEKIQMINSVGRNIFQNIIRKS